MSSLPSQYRFCQQSQFSETSFQRPSRCFFFLGPILIIFFIFFIFFIIIIILIMLIILIIFITFIFIIPFPASIVTVVIIPSFIVVGIIFITIIIFLISIIFIIFIFIIPFLASIVTVVITPSFIVVGTVISNSIGGRRRGLFRQCPFLPILLSHLLRLRLARPPHSGQAPSTFIGLLILLLIFIVIYLWFSSDFFYRTAVVRLSFLFDFIFPRLPFS